MNFEQQQLRQFLETLGPEDEIALPVEASLISWGERPDVRLGLPVGSVGIELTVAAEQEAIRGHKLRNSGKTQGVTTDSGLRDRAVRRTDQELIAAMQNIHGPHLWQEVGGVAQRIVTKFCERLNSKVERAMQPGYERFSRNWLFMSDPTQVMGNRLQATEVGRRLMEVLNQNTFSGCPFDLITLRFPDGYFKIRLSHEGEEFKRALNGYDMTRNVEKNVIGTLPLR